MDQDLNREVVIYIPLPPELQVQASLRLTDRQLSAEEFRQLRDSIANVLDELAEIQETRNFVRKQVS